MRHYERYQQACRQAPSDDAGGGKIYLEEYFAYVDGFNTKGDRICYHKENGTETVFL